MLEDLQAIATRRTVLRALAVVIVIALALHVIAVPIYREVASGLVPFDLQDRLTREMIAIQRGAQGPGAAQAYILFSAFAFVLQWAGAGFLILFWAWIMAQTPHQAFNDLSRHGLFVVPLLGALCHTAESVTFAMLVAADSHNPMHDLTSTALTIHRIKSLLMDADMAITLTLAIFAYYLGRRRLRVK
jgi:hypothetical protein